MRKEKEIKINIKGKITNIKIRIIPKIKKHNKEIKSIYEDCFAYKEATCSALNDLYCKNEECRFYKTEKQLLSELEKRKGVDI